MTSRSRPSKENLSTVSIRAHGDKERNGSIAFTTGIATLIAVGVGAVTLPPSIVALGGTFLAGLTARYAVAAKVDGALQKQIETIFKHGNLNLAVAHRYNADASNTQKDYKRLEAASQAILLNTHEAETYKGLKPEHRRLVYQQQILALTGFYIADQTLSGRKLNTFMDQIIPDKTVKLMLETSPSGLQKIPGVDKKLEETRDKLLRLTKNIHDASIMGDHHLGGLMEQKSFLQTAKTISSIFSGRTFRLLSKTAKMTGPLPKDLDYDQQRDRALQAAQQGKRFIQQNWQKTR